MSFEWLEPKISVTVEPTWTAFLPSLLVIVRDGTYEGYLQAKIELEKMAKAADLYNQTRDPV